MLNPFVVKPIPDFPAGVHTEPHFDSGFCLCYCVACFATKDCICENCKHNDSKESK